MSFLDLFRLGKGRFTDKQREALQAEGAIILEEGLSGTVRYTHFKAPGRRFHGKVTPEKMAIGVTRRRFMIYCRNGRAKLADSEFTSPHLHMVTVSAEDEGTFLLHVDYDKATDQPKVSGQIAIRAKSPNAAAIAEAINRGLGRD